MTRLAAALAACLALLVLAATAIAAHPTAGAEYKANEKGCVGLCPTLDLTVRKDGKHYDFKSDWDSVCTSGSSDGLGNNDWDGSTDGTGYKVQKSGSFKAAGSYKVNSPHTYGGPAKSGTVHFSLKGKFKSAKKAPATVKVSVSGRDASGKQVDKCTDTEHFLLKRQ